VVGGDLSVRSSRVLGVLDAILHSPWGSWRVVELVGRGIAAEARCAQAVLKDKSTVSIEPVAVLLQRATEAADHLIGLGAIEDDLADAWRRRRTNELDGPAFEAALDSVVRRLEAWPAAAAAFDDVTQLCGWVAEQHVVRLLRQISAYVSYPFDDLDEAALTSALDDTNDETTDRWFEYPLAGTATLLIRLARSPGTTRGQRPRQGAVGPILAAQIDTLLDLL
jgi:hypothetical protein